MQMRVAGPLLPATRGILNSSTFTSVVVEITRIFREINTDGIALMALIASR